LSIVKQLWHKYGLAITLCVITMAVLNIIFGTVCISSLIVGIPCPGCGITRAAKYLLTGQLRKSFEMHPLLILVIIGIILYFVLIKFSQKARLIINTYAIICLIIFIIFYIYRMYKYFPNVEPLVYRENNLAAYLKGVINRLKYQSMQ